MTGPDRVPVRPDLAGVEPYGAPQLETPVRLNTNETAAPPPDSFAAALAESIDGLALHRYPDRPATALREALAARFGLPTDQVWAANGSNEVLLQLFQAYGGPDRRMLLFRPGYSAHPLIARVSGTPVVQHDLPDDFALTPRLAADAMAAHDPDVVVIASPNNPSGVPTPAAAIRELHDGGRALVIVDEAYVEFDGTGGGTSAVALLAGLPRLVVTRTFSKAYRLAGLRLGYLMAAPWVVEDLRKVRLPYHLDQIKQAAGIVALRQAELMLAHIPGVVEERERVAAALAEIDGVDHVWGSAANFLLLRTGATGLFERLLARGVLVRDFSTAPRLEGCIRVTIGTRRENDAFLVALRDALAESAQEATP